MARAIFRLRLPDGTTRLATGTTDGGPTDLLAPDVTVLVKGSRFMQMERVIKKFELAGGSQCA